MNTFPRNNQRGFVLITSLIFLAVVTLLAVSAINSSTLQEKIAANTRAQETAEQHANAALREGETLLDEYVDTYEPVGSDVPLVGVPSSISDTTPDSIHIWREYGMLPSSSGTAGCEPSDSSALNFLNCDIWDVQVTHKRKPITYTTDAGDTLAHYYIEELDGCYQADLDPDACATGRVVIYRITARATDANATVVTQSTFEKYY